MTVPAHVDRTIIDIIEGLRALSNKIDCAVACISGGVDSTTAAVLARMALGEKVHPVFIDTGFMRLNEAERVRCALRGLIDVEVHDYSESFISRVEGLSDAEEKRTAFRDCFYTTVREIAQGKGCSFVVQGTIKADVIETVGGIKTQHNVLNRELLLKYGLEVIEPLAGLYKQEVRAIAKRIGLPGYIVERQPFPGPGLLIRAVGRLYREKLELVRRITDLVEVALAGRGISQYFPAVWEHEVLEASRFNGLEYEVFTVRTTGVSGGKRSYGHPVVIKRWPDGADPYGVYKRFDTQRHPHVLVSLAERGTGSYLLALRAVVTEDFIRAEVPRIDPIELEPLVREILRSREVRAVALDVTPKPPATIEYE